MIDIESLPASILNKVKGLKWETDNIGMSGSNILLFDKMVLKIETAGCASCNEVKLLSWLKDKLPVPEIIEAETRDGKSYLLMSRMTGEMACSEQSLNNMGDTVKALSSGIKMLWQIDIDHCPFVNGVTEKLIQAKSNIDGDRLDDDFEGDTFGPNGFKDHQELYDCLERHKPDEDMVFAHGDYCFPNVFLKGDKTCGFIDWGYGGIADRYQDIALCIRSLRHNFSGQESEYLRYRDILLSELDIEPDWDKVRYFILLDELF